MVANIQRLAIAGQGAAYVAQVCVIRIPLNIADTLVSSSEFALQGSVFRGFLREAVEKVKGASDQEFAHGGGTGKVANCVVDIKNHRGGKTADVIESPLCDTRFTYGRDE